MAAIIALFQDIACNASTICSNRSHIHVLFYFIDYFTTVVTEEQEQMQRKYPDRHM